MRSGRQAHDLEPLRENAPEPAPERAPALPVAGVIGHLAPKASATSTAA